MKFLPLAEDAGLMQELTHWVLNRGAVPVRRMATIPVANMIMSVNITTTNLLEDGFTELVNATP